jgi:hypothetical protein
MTGMDFDPQKMEALVNALGRKLEERAAAPAQALEKTRSAADPVALERITTTRLNPDDPVMVTATKLRALYAICPTEQKSVVPIAASSMTEGMTLASFKSSMVKYGEPGAPGPRGGQPPWINPADIWLKDKRLLTVAGLRMRPDMPGPTYEEDGKVWVNVYNPPRHEAAPEGLEVFLAFMEHLVPDKSEREWYLDVWAHKFQHPHIPGPAVIHVAAKRQQGTGRGTLFAIKAQLFGEAYVRKVDSGVLTGDGGQSQYNTWLANSVMVQVDELFNDAGRPLFQRQKAYERIKAVIDPAARSVEIIQKIQNNYAARTYASVEIATNNPNALPLDEDDRRTGVLTNGGKLEDNPALKAALDRYRDDDRFTPGFIAAVAGFLADRSTARFDPYAIPPMFEGKRRMIAANVTDAGAAADDALENLRGDFVTRNAFLERVRLNLDDPHEHKGWKTEARDRIERSPWLFLGRVKLSEKGSKADVWARNEAAKRLWLNTSLAERQALLAANDDPRGQTIATRTRALMLGLETLKGGKNTAPRQKGSDPRSGSGGH